MIHPSGRRAVATSALALVLTLTVTACGGQDTDVPGTAGATASHPAASGTGPYPTPTDADASPTVPVRSTGTPKGGVPQAADVKRTDADAVSKGALKALWTYDTTVDSGPVAAGVRAADAGWLTAEYGLQLRSQQGGSVSSAQWREWAGHRAYTTVALSAADDAARPPDTGTEAWRQWIVTTTPHGRDQWTGKADALAVYVQLTRTGPGKAWQVAGVRLQ
ncbi:hypothetical protein [Streptomyces sp. NPDC087294]|uniref:hypothetical protein n=1 Tax=Streptomyces sp. NPDC087294 TaxID=3365777 RepID=UPI00381739AA